MKNSDLLEETVTWILTTNMLLPLLSYLLCNCPGGDDDVVAHNCIFRTILMVVFTCYFYMAY